MPRIPSKNTRRHRMIEDALSVGMSGNKIQKFLRENGLGIRRKKLYEEIRAINKETVSKEKREKSVPKKYRKKGIIKKKWIDKTKKIGYIYRGSLIISSTLGVPLHSTPFNRHYLGFRLNIFSYNKDIVYYALRDMKEQFIKMVGNKLKSYAYASEQTLGTENPKKINVNNPKSLNGKWFFAVEEKGRDTEGESGYI